MNKVLIANRGEIAVRIAQACADEGIRSVAVYADEDRDAVFVRTADEAFALQGKTPADTYLDQRKILQIAMESGADAVHPGYGFLAENGEFAQRVIDSGLIWIGPPPSAIEALGNKIAARDIAKSVGAPLAAGTDGPVSDLSDVEAFVEQHGLPVAIKAAYGGGGRGLKVVREGDSLEHAFDSAVREAVAAFGRGECFVEKYLDRPRHVETQCLADEHGGVVVVSTRDCSLQRRHQKLVEEAPAPFLTPEQERALRDASKAIMKRAGYVGAGTCEFLVGADGTISFLEVNTRLQVEHPVTEEVAGVDLVREQFRIARGEALGYDDPVTRGHSIEFRINTEDPAAGFMPAAGKLARFSPPSGPGVRLDTGVGEGDTTSANFDSMLAKLIVTGRDRRQALQRARRALDQFVVEGVPTVIPFHRAVVNDPAFAPEDDGPFAVYTSWIENEFSMDLAPFQGAAGTDGALATDARETIVVEVGRRRLEVSIPASLTVGAAPASTIPAGASRRRARAQHGPGPESLVSPMQGSVVKVERATGDTVAEGDLVLVIEAMKMEQPIRAHRAGVVAGLSFERGDTVQSGAVVCSIM
ncbi:acetyl/propionyl/methylcrotonyl-CoA carboxylase subunit alpha [Ruicaihuangia caeni]|uniref:acetyl/propionyl/methylcrotonyl-CoA carboxylase subunit alpha n=1 Tax=Ruicaihuangia caeni TaxID=3042517 RepID=UPI003BF6082A